jgi:hypothetical protein
MRSRFATAFGVSFALHLLLAALVAGLPRPFVVPVQAPSHGQTIAVFAMPPTEDATFKGLNPVDRSQSEWTLPPGDGPEALRIGDLDIDVGRIRERALVLFPFLTPGLSLDHFLEPGRNDLRASLENPYAKARRRQGAAPQPLALNDAGVQALVDKAWSRGDRWAAFEPIGRLVEAHSPNEGQAPKLIQFYSEQNALQPYADRDNRDPRLWAQLGLAADHVAFIRFIREFAAAHPSTKATTELLFLLDRVAEANRDALRVMRESDPAEVLGWTREANPDAYRLVNRLRAFYQSELDRRGLKSEDAIDRYYDKARLAILQGIVRTTPGGYRANDARFIAGALLWRQGDTNAAVQTWREMTPDPDGGILVAGPQITAALRRAGFPLDAAFRRNVDQILKNDLGRWLAFSRDRLDRFGYRVDTF